MFNRVGRYPLSLSLTLVLIVLACHSAQAAPRGGVASAGREEEEKPQATTQQASGQLSPPVLERRIITKVNGVVVEERDGTPVDAPMIDSNASFERAPDQAYAPGQSDSVSPKEVRKPDGVVYAGEVVEMEIPETDGLLDAEAAAPSELVQENKEPAFFDQMFGNFFSPNREADSNRMRAGKGRAQHLAPDGTPAPEFPPIVVMEPPAEAPFIAPSTNLILGELVSVDLEQGIAVSWMQTRFITLNRDVVSRNHELEITGRLRPAHIRSGRAYGLEIISGEPRVGDELVLANAEGPDRRQDELSYNVSLTVEPSN